MSSFSGSLATVYSSLRANGSYFNLISENISNANTPGYKAKGATFAEKVAGQSDLTYGTGRLASFNGFSGAQFDYQHDLFSAGAIANTNKDTDFAFSNGGLFVTRQSFDNADAPRLTANGSFQRRAVERQNEEDVAVDNLIPDQRVNQFDTYLVDKNDHYLLGWPYDQATDTFANGQRDVNALRPVNIRENVPYIQEAAATTSAELDYNVPSDIPVGEKTSFTFRIYDGSGEAINTDEDVFVKQTWERLNYSDWKVGFESDTINNRGDFEQNQSWVVSFAADGTLEKITNQDGTEIGGSTVIPVTLIGAGANDEDISLDVDIAKVTQYKDEALSKSSSLPDRGGTVIDGNPYRLVDYESMDIEQDGTLIVKFSHNITVPVARIPLASVANPNGLKELDGPNFEVTQESGEIRLFDLSQTSRSQVYNKALAQSTTDFAVEFTNMIEAQRSYNTASTALQTIDEMIRNATQLKRG